MSLPTQVVPIVLTQGLDTKSDPRACAVGRLLTLENAVFTAPGRLNKRHGYDALTRGIQGSSSSISSAQALLSFNSELLLCDGTRMYSYSQSTGNWLDKGAAVSVTASVSSVVRNAYTQSNPDSAVNSGVRVTAWEDSRGGIRYSAQDATTGAFYVQDGLVSNAIDGGSNSTAKRPRVVAFGRDLVIFYCLAANLFYKRVGVSSPTVLGAEFNPVSTLVSNISQNQFDVLVVGADAAAGRAGRLFIAYNSSSGAPATKIVYFDSLFTLSAATTVAATASSAAIGLFSDADSNVYVAMASSSAVSLQVVNYALALVGSAYAVETVANVKAITGVAPTGSSASRPVGFAYVYYETAPDSDVTHHIIRTSALNLVTNTAGAASDFKRSVGLASRAWSYGAGRYVTTAYQSKLQATYFVADGTGAIVAKFNAHTGGGVRTSATVANVTQTSAGIFEMACVQQSRLAIQGGVLFAFAGAAIASLNYVSVNAFNAAKVNNNFLLGGGIVQSYDGVSLTEAGFHLFPEGVTADTSDALTITITQAGDGSHPEITSFLFAGTGRISAGQYFQLNSTTTAIYVWYQVDGVGTDPAVGGRTGIKVTINSSDGPTTVAAATSAAINAAALGVTSTASTGTLTTTNSSNGAVTHATNPAAPNGLGTGSVTGSVQYSVIYEWSDNFGQIVRSAPSVALSVTAAANGSVTLAIPTLRLTTRDGVTRTPVRIAIYRTQNALTIPFRITSITTPLLNSVTTDTVYYFDGATDASIAGNELLYTFGGVLENDPPPGAPFVVTYKNRAVLAGGQDRNTIAYSQLTSQYDPVSFDDALTITIDQRGGDITALGVLDDKLVIFKRSSIFVLDGEGPNNTGQGSSFSVPSLISTDVGCINQQSVVFTEMGLLFQSTKGFYLLDRSLATQYIGAAVEAFNSVVVTGATLVPNTNQVRFTTTSDVCLVYDYLVNQWATFTNHTSAGCVVSSEGTGTDLFHLARTDGTVWRENLSTFLDPGNAAIRLKLVTGELSFAGIQGFQRVRRLLILGNYRGAHRLVVQIATDGSPAFTQYASIDATSIVASSVYGSDPKYGVSGVYGGAYTPYQFRIHVVHQKCESLRISVEDAQSSGYNEGYSINALTLEVGVKQGPFKVPAAGTF